jgi:hypothetical protein
MATLTEISMGARKAVKITLISLVAIIVIRVGTSMFLSYWKSAHPPKPAPPAMRFGKIPKLNLENIKSTGSFTFKLETPTNTLPKLSDRADVYYSPFSQPNLLALEKAKQQAILLGFTEAEEKINEKNYRWKKSIENTVLEMNIINNTFTLKHDWKQNQSLINNRLPFNDTQAIAEAKKILKKNGLLPNDIANGSAKTTYQKISGQQIVKAVSLSEANLIKIDFYRENINDLPVNTIKYETGVIQIIMSGTKTPKDGIIEINYLYFPIDYNSRTDYPIKNSASLWNQFSGGGGYIISQPKTNVDTIVIRRVYLGYLDTLREQKFMQPVLFLEGDQSFFGFVPALDDGTYQ